MQGGPGRWLGLDSSPPAPLTTTAARLRGTSRTTPPGRPFLRVLFRPTPAPKASLSVSYGGEDLRLRKHKHVARDHTGPAGGAVVRVPSQSVPACVCSQHSCFVVLHSLPTSLPAPRILQRQRPWSQKRELRGKSKVGLTPP